LQTAAIDVARDDAYGYVDGVLKPIGLLLEGAATNLITYSEDFTNAAWRKSGAEVTPDAFAGPFGEVSATKLAETNANSEHFIEQLELPTAAGTYTQSFYLRAGTLGFCAIMVVHLGEEFSTSTISINILEGTTTNPDNLMINAKVKNFAGGWLQVFVTYLLTGAATSVRMRLYSGVLGTRQGDPVNFVYIDKTQVEEGYYPTSYIPTQGTQVTRAADVSSSPQVTRAADSCVRVLGDEFNDKEITVYVEGKIPRGDFKRLLYLSGPSDNNIALGLSQTTGKWFFSAKVNGVVQTDFVITDIDYDVVVKWAFSFKNGTYKLYKDGELFQTETVKLFPVGLNALQVGGNGSNVGALVKNTRIFPTALSEAELITLTGGN